MRARLIHPVLDPWFLGGLPLLIILLCQLLPGNGAEPFLPVLPLVLMLFSYPHFAASYAAFYGRKHIWKAHGWAAVAVPALLIVILGFIVLTHRETWLQNLMQITLFLLYWHYVKQVYGSCIWLGTMWDRSLSRLPRKLLLGTCLLLGSLGFLMAQGGEGQRQVFGLYVPFLPMPVEVQDFARGLACLVTVATCLWFLICIRKQKAERSSWLVLLPLVALWFWFEPRFQNSLTLALLPALHGLQYLPFALRVLWNRQAGPWRGPRLLAWCLFLILIGTVAFTLVPRELILFDGEGLPSAWLIFLNLHHYAIDASMWRLGRSEVRASLTDQMEPCRTSSVE